MERGRRTILPSPPPPARPPKGRVRDRLRFAIVAFALLAIPVALAAWVVSTELEARHREATDVRLATSLRTAAAALSSRIAAADLSARALASEPAVQRAILDVDAKQLTDLERRTPGLVVFAAGTRLAGKAPSDAIIRTVAVVGRRGQTLGRVGTAIVVDGDLLARLAPRAGAVLLAERSGRVAAGPVATGARLRLSNGEARTVDLGSRRYRAAATLLPGSAGRLVAVVSASELEAAAAERNRYIAIAALTTVLALALVAEALIPIVRRRVRAHTAADEEESIELLGSALAAAHDRTALLPVILESIVEATGAVGGVLVEDGDEVAVIGDRPPLTDPLRLTLAGENGSEAIALIYPPFRGFSDVERRRAERLAAQASVAVEHARQHAIARRDATTDPLTGLANRRRFTERLAAEASRHSRSGRPVALIVADLDDFKHVNDRHGHPVGDDVLRAFAGVLRQTLREIDVAARLGGEEFAILMPETDGDGAATVAGRLRERLERLELDLPHGARLRVTASFGVASCPPIGRVEDLPAAADDALYAAKSEGKNRVVEAAHR